MRKLWNQLKPCLSVKLREQKVELLERTQKRCKGCDIVQSDHAPQAGVAQGSLMEFSSGAELDIR